MPKYSMLMKLALSLRPKKNPTKQEALKITRRERFPAPRPDFRLTLVAKCNRCNRSESVTYNAIWDGAAGKFRYQLNDVLSEDALCYAKILTINNCDLCEPEEYKK